MIDFDFIGKLEGSTLNGHVPDHENSNSGVTIGCGLDLGQFNTIELSRAFDADLTKQLSFYIGRKKQDACKQLELRPLLVTPAEEKEINRYVRSTVQRKLRALWRENETYENFGCLCDKYQTVVASVAFQYGNLKTKTPNFWKQVTSGDWKAALKNLRAFDDNYPTRRNKEADLLEKGIANAEPPSPESGAGDGPPNPPPEPK